MSHAFGPIGVVIAAQQTTVTLVEGVVPLVRRLEVRADALRVAAPERRRAAPYSSVGSARASCA